MFETEEGCRIAHELWKFTRATGVLPHRQRMYQTEDRSAPRYISAFEAEAFDRTTQRGYEKYRSVMKQDALGGQSPSFEQLVATYLHLEMDL